LKGELLFLGTGGSTGVPIIGCTCKVCTSPSPKNKRFRSSALVCANDKNFLIDVGPDFRTQALTHHITKLDGVLLTHTHFDHVGGIDDLRPYFFTQKKRMPCLLSKETFEEIKMRYHYLVQPLGEGHAISAQLDFFILEEDFGETTFEGTKWQYMSYHQAGMKVNGFRLGNMAYVSDIRTYAESLFDSLKGVEVLILSAFRTTVTEMHFSVDEAIAFAKRVGARQTYLTHIGHDLDAENQNLNLPENVKLSYDGLKIQFSL
jgi:phosphoribosyl 1,2-cyclic phosphate phosphodiesterase